MCKDTLNDFHVNFSLGIIWSFAVSFPNEELSLWLSVAMCNYIIKLVNNLLNRLVASVNKFWFVKEVGMEDKKEIKQIPQNLIKHQIMEN